MRLKFKFSIILFSLILAPRYIFSQDFFNVKNYGAIGNGTSDDTYSIQAAINAANSAKGAVWFPAGTYKVSNTLTITDGQGLGSRIEGVNAVGVKIKSYLTGNNPVFKFRGGSGTFSNVGIKNISIEAAIPGTGTGIQIDGQCFGLYENLRLLYLSRGIWLYNNSPGAFSETNQFNQLNIDYCTQAIRMEKGAGSESFHGNDFNNVYINIGINQIGFYHHSGYYYNGRFRLFLWAHDTSSEYVRADGNAENNIGDITYESFKVGKLTGNGRFWYNGFLRGIGGVNDQSSSTSAWQKVFACDNFWKPVQYGTSGMTSGSLNSEMTSYNGPFGFFQSLKKNNVESVVLNTYSGSPENGFYLGSSGYQTGETGASLGMFLSSDGSKIKSYNNNGVSIENKVGDKLNINAGQLNFIKSNGETMSIKPNGTSMQLNGNVSVVNGAVTGFNILSGSVSVNGSQSKIDFKDAIPFSKMCSGKLILTTGDQSNIWAASSTYELAWGINSKKLTEFNMSNGWNGTYNEYLYAQFDDVNKKIRVGSNTPATIWYTFIGVLH